MVFECRMQAQYAYTARNGPGPPHHPPMALWWTPGTQDEKAARMKQEIYIRERQAVHDKYKARHLAQMRAVQSYEDRVMEEDRRRAEREQAISALEEEEAALLHRLRLAQELQCSAYDQLEVALQV